MSKTTGALLRPMLRLAELYPSGCVFNPREPYGGNPFADEDIPATDALTGPYLPFAGSMPVLCHRFVVTDRVRELVADAGFRWDAPVMPFQTSTEYRTLLAGQGPGSVVFQHAHSPDDVDPGLYRVPHKTLVELNDKAQVPNLAPAHAVPRRKLLSMAQWRSGRRVPEPPVVLKVPSEHSLGGGEGVRICRTVADVDNALAGLAATSEIIAEEFLDLTDNWCVQYACLPGRRVRYLGSAEQLVDEHGAYLGNWITAKQPPSEVLDIGWQIAVAGSAAGYLGIAGFDIAMTSGGRIFVLDLNFRVNGSTFGLLYEPSIQDAYGSREISFRTFSDPQGWRHLERIVRDAAGDGRILPFAGYDPGDRSTEGPARVSLLVTGASRHEVTGVIAQLRGCGLR